MRANRAPARRAGERRDAALSDVLGTVILLGVTVSLVAATALAFGGRSASGDPRHVPPALDVVASAAAGDTFVNVLHAGGTELSQGDLRVVVSVNGATLFDGDMGPAASSWRLGDVKTVQPLSAPISASGYLEVAVVFKPTGITLASIGVSVPPATTTAGGVAGFTVTVKFDGGTNVTKGEKQTTQRVTATVVHPQGRKAVRAVTVDLVPIRGSPVFPLFDDGIGADAVSGDGNFSAYAYVPANVTVGAKSLVVSAADVSGNVAKGYASLSIFDKGALPKYNTTFIKKIGWRVIKYDGPSNPKRDKVTIHLKMKIPPNNQLTLPNGTTWQLHRAYFAFDQLKGNDPVRVALNYQAVGGGYDYACFDGGAGPPATNNVVFKLDNYTISDYAWPRDTLRFTLTTEWHRVGGPNPVQTIDQYVTTFNYDPNLVTPRYDKWTVMQDDGWPTSFTSCTVE